MPTRPLPPVIGATENALRPLLTHVLSGSLIGGFDEWAYLNIQDGAGHPTQVEAQVADALKQPREAVATIRSRLVNAGLLDASGSLTTVGREQLSDRRGLIAQTTQALTDGIDPAAVQTTIETLETVRTRAEQLVAS